MAISVSVSKDNRIATIRIKGRFDFSLHNEFRKAYKDLAIKGGEFVIDLSATEYLDSSALGMMLLLKEHADETSCKVKIRNANDEILEILQIASFDKLFSLA